MNVPPSSSWSGLSVLVTGVCGTVGAELLRQIHQCGCERLIGLDNNESELFYLSQVYADAANVRLFLGDLCATATLLDAPACAASTSCCMRPP